MNDETMQDDDDYVSKTRLKQAMHDLRDMGKTLVETGNSRLDELDLPEALRNAIMEAKRIKSHGALRRQLQYIGKLMRSVDPAPIKAKLDSWSGNSKAEAARFHGMERWRERLLADETAVSEFIAEFPHADAQQLRTLIRNTRKETSENKPPKHSRALFRLIRQIMEDHPDES